MPDSTMKDGDINETRREIQSEMWLKCPANSRKGKHKINISAN